MTDEELRLKFPSGLIIKRWTQIGNKYFGKFVNVEGRHGIVELDATGLIISADYVSGPTDADDTSRMNDMADPEAERTGSAMTHVVGSQWVWGAQVCDLDRGPWVVRSANGSYVSLEHCAMPGSLYEYTIELFESMFIPFVQSNEQAQPGETSKYLGRFGDWDENVSRDPKVIFAPELELNKRFEAHPPAEPEPEPAPPIAARPGQRWQLGEDGPIARIIDALPDENPSVLIARVDGAVQHLSRPEFEPNPYRAVNWRYLDGPTEPETPLEVLGRVVELELADPPDGVTADAWRSFLIGMTEPRAYATSAMINIVGIGLAIQVRVEAQRARREPGVVAQRTWLR